MAVQILRLPTGIDFSHLECEIADNMLLPDSGTMSVNNSEIDLRGAVAAHPAAQMSRTPKLMHVDSNLNIDAMVGSSNNMSIPVPQIRE